jgi:hypothetical protein
MRYVVLRHLSSFSSSGCSVGEGQRSGTGWRSAPNYLKSLGFSKDMPEPAKKKKKGDLHQGGCLGSSGQVPNEHQGRFANFCVQKSQIHHTPEPKPDPSDVVATKLSSALSSQFPTRPTRLSLNVHLRAKQWTPSHRTSRRDLPRLASSCISSKSKQLATSQKHGCRMP